MLPLCRTTSSGCGGLGAAAGEPAAAAAAAAAARLAAFFGALRAAFDKEADEEKTWVLQQRRENSGIALSHTLSRQQDFNQVRRQTADRGREKWSTLPFRMSMKIFRVSSMGRLRQGDGVLFLRDSAISGPV
jgi:hypothetical protein